MSKTYLRWKDPTCNGKNIEWEEMSGKDFIAFLNSEQSNGRYFIKLDNDICHEADVVFIEATFEQYQNWRTEMLHHLYLRHINPGYRETSIDIFDNSKEMSLHEMIPADGLSPEAIVEQSDFINRLWMAISSLSEAKQAIVLAKYFWFPNKKEEEIAAALKLDYGVYRAHLSRAIKQIKKFMKIECHKI